MNRKAFLVLTLLSATTWAAPTQYRINSQVYIDGKLVSSPKIITMANETAEIRQTTDNTEGASDIRVRVTPSEFQNDAIPDGILMKFEVEYKAGNRVVKSSPQIIARSGSEAEVTVGRTPGQDDLKLKVTATQE